MHQASSWDPWPIGWRARIGFIVPSKEPGVMQHEYGHIFPPGVVMVDTKIMLRTGSPEAFLKMSEEAVYAAEMLKTSKVDVISYHCAASGIMHGVDYEKKLLDRLRQAGGAECTSLSLAAVEALKSLKVRKIAVTNPHLKRIAQAEKEYLQAAGFEVVGSQALDIEDSLSIAERSPWENYRFVLETARQAPEAEAVFISCGIFRSIEIIEVLERTIGKPVVSSVVCNAWKCLQLAGVREPIAGFGELLAGKR